MCTYSRIFVHSSRRSLPDSQHMNRAMDNRLVSASAATYLVARENQRISNHNVLTAPSSKHDDLSNVVGGKWLAVPT